LRSCDNSIRENRVEKKVNKSSEFFYNEIIYRTCTYTRVLHITSAVHTFQFMCAHKRCWVNNVDKLSNVIVKIFIAMLLVKILSLVKMHAQYPAKEIEQ